jgi:hypothetical protein
MEAAIELFNNECDGYPPSEVNDPTGKPYCGAMKLAEALMGQDLRGFHPSSIFRCDGFDSTGTVDLYPDRTERLNPALRNGNLKARRGPYLPAESANTWRLADIYGKGRTGSFPEDTLVLCDTYERKRPGGARTGMPILYYRAITHGASHEAGDPNRVYDAQDNQMLIALGAPGKTGKTHPLLDPKRFYLNTQDTRVSSRPQPYRGDFSILISAGRDGLYGTADDICNFTWQYRE